MDDHLPPAEATKVKPIDEALGPAAEIMERLLRLPPEPHKATSKAKGARALSRQARRSKEAGAS